MTPIAWRKSQNLSQAAAAALVGVQGRNPARTWQRWEAGEREPPLLVVVMVEKISKGRVLAKCWPAASKAKGAVQKPEMGAAA